MVCWNFQSENFSLAYNYNFPWVPISCILSLQVAQPNSIKSSLQYQSEVSHDLDNQNSDIDLACLELIFRLWHKIGVAYAQIDLHLK